ncbi:hypothetical protein D3C78_1268920 [compost metagenome]
MRVEKSAAAPAAKAPAQKAAAPAQEAKMSMDFDTLSFGRPAPTAAQIAAAKKTIAELASTPGIPLRNDAKQGWLETAKQKQAAAEAALDVLRDAEWEKKLPQDDLMAARDAVHQHADQIVRCEERAGLKPMPKPRNPFRPLGENTAAIGNAPNNIFGALIASFGLMVAIPLDIVDGITRPIQAVMWPVAHAWRGAVKLGNMVGIG